MKGKGSNKHYTLQEELRF